MCHMKAPHSCIHACGVAFLVHQDVPYCQIDTKCDDFLKALVIAVKTENKICLANVYIPPSTSCAPDYKPDPSALLDMADVIVCGDFNAHSKPRRRNKRHSPIRAIRERRFSYHQWQPVHKSAFASAPSYPDITLAHRNLAMSTRWNPWTALSSDHRPIIIDIEMEVQQVYSDKKTYVNFQKADWTGFKELIEHRIHHLPISAVETYTRWREPSGSWLKNQQRSTFPAGESLVSLPVSRQRRPS